MAKLWSNRIIQELDGDAAPYAGAKLFTYEAGSSTKETTYQDADGTTAHANPIVLDANGRIPAGVFLTEGQAYKFVLAPSDDTDPPASPIWTLDDIEGINDTNITIDQWEASNLTPTYVSSTSFTLTGDQTTEFHIGRKLKVTDAGGSKYCRITNSVFTTLTTVTVEGDALATPTSAVSVGIITRTNTSLPAIEDDELIVIDPAAPTKRARLDAGDVTAGQTRVLSAPDYNARIGNLPAGIGPLPYAGATIPTGWLECDGSAVSRTTYAALFTAIGTAWGAGDESTTFNVPDMRDRVPIGAGTGTVTESGEDADVDTGNDTLTVPSNNTKWVTGMAVVFNLTSGTITGLSDDTTYYVIRASSTTIKLASTLANAQNGTAIDLTAKSSPVWDITHTYTARTLGSYGGEETHAMSSTELLAHVHNLTTVDGDVAGGSEEVARLSNSGSTSNSFDPDSFGGNAAMNIMQPFAVVKYIISY